MAQCKRVERLRRRERDDSMYSLYASLRHRPNICILYSVRPASAAAVAAPLLKEWPEKRDASKPARVSRSQRLDMNAEYCSGEPSPLQKIGDPGGQGSALNKDCSAVTAQVEVLTAAIKMVTHLRNGSVLEAGKVMLMVEGTSMDGKNETELRVR
jgi:hypothetical protein